MSALPTVPVTGRGSLRTVLDELHAIALQVQVARPELHVYRWWRPDVALPCIHHWLTPSPHERVDMCRGRDVARITVSLAVDPQSTVAEDAGDVETYFDTALPFYDFALYEARPLGGQQEAKRTGTQMVSDRYGDAPVLVLEQNVEVHLDRLIRPSP